MTTRAASGRSDDAENLPVKSNGEPWDGQAILIVDDEEHIHEYFKLLMKSAARLGSTYSASEGIDAARRGKPDLILMDVQLTDMDGLEFVKCLKSDPETNGIPILAVTGKVMEEDRVRIARAGANGYVTKPIDIETFTKEVDRVLGAGVK